MLRHVYALKDRLIRLRNTGSRRALNIANRYVKSAPDAQQTLDIFKGEWASLLPGPIANLQAGSAVLFADKRLEWAMAQLDHVQDKTVVELGPLEGGHTYMLEQNGAREIVAIEANTHAYLKCLIVKELLQLKRASFLYGDFVEYLRRPPQKFDICIASGVLYHMASPVELLSLMAKASDAVYLWTHYYDREILSATPHLAHRFPNSTTQVVDGYQHTLYRQEYKSSLLLGGFCGGTETYSYWMARDEILECLRFFGLTDISIAFEDPHHQNGPSFSIVAKRI